MTVPTSFAAPPRPSRLADLWWLLAHDEHGRPRLGGGHYALGLAAAAVGEAMTQPGIGAADYGGLVADPVVAHVSAELTGAAAERVVRSARPWVEWLATHEHARTEGDVVGRLIGAGWLVRAGRRLVPVDALTAFTTISMLVTAIRDGRSPSDQVRVLAGLALACGLDGLLVTGGENVRPPLQQLVLALPKPLMAVVTAADDAIQALATRHR